MGWQASPGRQKTGAFLAWSMPQTTTLKANITAGIQILSHTWISINWPLFCTKKRSCFRLTPNWWLPVNNLYLLNFKKLPLIISSLYKGKYRRKQSQDTKAKHAAMQAVWKQYIESKNSGSHDILPIDLLNKIVAIRKYHISYPTKIPGDGDLSSDDDMAAEILGA